MATKINRKLNGTDSIEKELGDLIDSGGTIGGQLYIKDGLTIRDSSQASFCGDTKVYRNNAIGGTFGIELKARLNSSNYGSVAIGGDIGTWSALMPTMSNMNLGKADMPWSTLYLGTHQQGTVGHTVLPNGYLLQWGRYGGSFSNGHFSADLKFPITFPYMIVSGGVSLLSAGGFNEGQCGCHFTYPNTVQFTLKMQQNGNGAGGNHAFDTFWWALGY